MGATVFPSPTNTDLTTIPWRTRAWLTAREAVGIVWIGLLGSFAALILRLSTRDYGALGATSFDVERLEDGRTDAARDP